MFDFFGFRVQVLLRQKRRSILERDNFVILFDIIIDDVFGERC